jgi:hypothetical protein
MEWTVIFSMRRRNEKCILNFSGKNEAKWWPFPRIGFRWEDNINAYLTDPELPDIGED